MDLQKIEEVSVARAIMKLESRAIRPISKFRVGFLRLVSALVMVGGGATFFILLAVICAVVFQHWALAALFFSLNMLGAIAACLSGVFRYVPDYPYSKPHLLAFLDSDARAFAEENWETRRQLAEDAEAYNRALRAMKSALPENTGDEVAEGVVENFVERRRKLMARFAAYEEAFETAAAEEIKQVRRLKNGDSGKPKTKRQRRKAFNTKVWQLKQLQEALDGLKDSVESGMTVDLSPYIAAQRLRAELEEEREAMLAEGMKPKKLPTPHSWQPKLLPSEA